MKRSRSRALSLLAVAGLVFAACSAAATPTPPPAGGGAPEALITAAKAEGTLTTIALPDDWCNYREVIDSFKAKYGLAVNELDPGASSGVEIEAIKANQANPGPQAPDVVDVGFSFGEDNKDLFEPYKVATWDSIPDAAKSADGLWWGDYYGVMSFTTNTAIQPNPPKDWSDLLKPEYKGQIALDGDPRASNQGTITQGATPIALRWSYNGLSHRDSTAGNPTIDVTVPTSGRFGGVYVQALSKDGPPPNAAQL